MDAKIKAYYAWYEKTYAETVGLKRLAAVKELKDVVLRFNYAHSNIWRHEVLTNSRYYYMPKKTEQICILFRLSRNYARQKTQYHSTYAFLYGTLDRKAKPERLVYDFVCACPTFRSADGEYRHRFLRYAQFAWVYKEHMTVLEAAEAVLRRQAEAGEIQLMYEQAAGEPIPAKQLDGILKQDDLAIRLLVLCWIIDNDRFHKNNLENHLADGYQQALIGPGDSKLFGHWTASMPSEQLGKLQGQFTRFWRNKEQHVSVTEIGQKLIPMTVAEIERIGDLHYRPWREIHAATEVGRLVINGISPAFPIFNDWFLLDGSSKFMYDNKVNHVRLDHATIAGEIVRKMEAARRGTFVLDPVTKREVFISYHLEGLAEAIEVPMDYAEQEIVLSKWTLCTLTEHVGRTFADVPYLNLRPAYASSSGPLLRELVVFKRYVFEYLFGLAMLHSKLGMIHTDLHLNNVTLAMKRQVIHPETGEYVVPQPHILYELSATERWLLPTFGKFACIIDFSRVVILNGETDEPLLTEDRNRILHTLERELPDFYRENRKAIYVALLQQPVAFFRLFSAIDGWKLCHGLAAWLPRLVDDARLREVIDPMVIKEEIVPWLRRIADRHFAQLTSGILALAAKNRAADPDEWPLFETLRVDFEEFRLAARLVALGRGDWTLIDYFSALNNPTYRTDDYEQFPPTAKFDYITEHKIEIEQASLENYEAYRKYVAAHPPAAELTAISEEEEAAKAARRGTPTRPDLPAEADSATIYEST